MYFSTYIEKKVTNTAKKITLALTLFISLLFIPLSGCSQLVSQSSGDHSVSSSLVDFLYPNEKNRVKHKEEIPVLRLPVRVGIAFLPSVNWRARGLDEANKIKLLNKVRDSFGKHRFIESISIIPSVYLKTSRGFSSLERVAKLHNVDVMALVSYDQMMRSKQNTASLLYWTIVGMYVIPGNENNVQTFVDTAVFDVRSREMLLRAPGVSSLRKRSTAIGVDSTLAHKSLQGFNLAFDDMINNLNNELSQFRARAKSGTSGVTIQHRQGYSGGGAMAWLLLGLLGVALININEAKTEY